ncbi:DUF3224 domain-containing protein [Streptomyces sp. NPDC097981]|uniref:DUF3224 domain-containing protein n=1 Tax=Streptomyces sp. NPDC097981 TaxID=3155428 RepID=UPI00332D4CE8
MGMPGAVADRIGRGETAEFRATGDSAAPLIRSRQRVRVAPVGPALVRPGDIALARVAGTEQRGTFDAAGTRCTFEVVPGSATGEPAWLTGSGSFTYRHGGTSVPYDFSHTVA